MKTFLSTKAVGDLLGVTETTIKRWSADGKLPCVKTPGGHRKYRMKDVLLFAEDQGYPITGLARVTSESLDAELLEFSIFKRDFRPVTATLLDCALKGERTQILDLLNFLAKHQVGIASIGDEVIRPVMVEIGNRWNDGRLEINEEHIASQALLEAVIRLSPDLPRKSSNGLTAVCACAEGDHHEIGLRLLSYALEGEGWHVHYLGANTPFDTLRSFLASARPELLCLSYALQMTDDVRSELRTLGALARSVGAAFLIGGVSASAMPPEELGCDAIAGSVREAVDHIRGRFQLNPGPKKQMSSFASGGAA